LGGRRVGRQDELRYRVARHRCFKEIEEPRHALSVC
jgi:hypothetical protein